MVTPAGGLWSPVCLRGAGGGGLGFSLTRISAIQYGNGEMDIQCKCPAVIDFEHVPGRRHWAVIRASGSKPSACIFTFKFSDKDNICFSGNMCTMKQLKLFSQNNSLEFGGTLNRGRRKTARPLDTKRSVHFVLKATNPHLLLRYRRRGEQLTQNMSRRFGVRLYGFAVEADHIHLSARITNRVLYRRWIRALTSGLVRVIPGLKFAYLPYSRIVNWGRQFKTVCAYIRENFRHGDFLLQCHLRVEGWILTEKVQFLQSS
jgi:hypothetical protein